VPEKRTREVCHTVMVPVQKSETFTACACDVVNETKTESYVVRVPKKVTEKKCVKVKKCVEEQVPAGAAGGACGSGNGGSGRGGLLGHCKKGC
jgi:hypothetical protein